MDVSQIRLVSKFLSRIDDVVSLCYFHWGTRNKVLSLELFCQR